MTEPSGSIDHPTKDVHLNKCLHHRTKLANLGWDHTVESLHLPAITESGKWIYGNMVRSSINKSMVNMFTILKALSSLTDFLHNKLDLPHHNPLV